MIDTKNAAEIGDWQGRLLDWFAVHQRPLPWRSTYAPYHVWISEIMGQQTQMDRVAQYFMRWIERFPDLTSVALAPEQAILKAWEGLGYYSRARNLQRTAIHLIENGIPEIPADYHHLLSLPGIGPYTASAILSIGFNKPYPLLDANVERLFARVADIDQPLKQGATKKQLAGMAEALLDHGNPRSYNQALMELGALVCTPKKPSCSACPVQIHCKAHDAGTVELRPLPTGKKQKIDIVMACGILRRNSNYFIQQRFPNDLWGGLWEFPGGQLEAGESPEQAVIREIREETGWQIKNPTPLKTVTHYYTKYRVTLHGFLCTLPDSATEPVLTAATQHAWVCRSQLSDYPFPAGHRQLVSILCGNLFAEIR